MYRYLRNLAFAIAIFTAPAIADEWPEALKTALAEQKNEATYSFKINIEQYGEVSYLFVEALIDPSRSPNERIEILSPRPGSERGDAKLLGVIDESIPESIWCSAIADSIPKDVVLVEETPDILVFSFRPKVSKDNPTVNRRIFKKLEGQIVIEKNTMTVRSYRLKNRKHIRMMVVAKLRKFLFEMECELAPNGRSYKSKGTMTMEIGILGERSTETQTTLISNLTPVQMPDETSESSF